MRVQNPVRCSVRFIPALVGCKDGVSEMEAESMKRFFAQLSTHQTINRPADRMVLEDNTIRVYGGNELVAIMDVSTVMYAHICEG